MNDSAKKRANMGESLEENAAKLATFGAEIENLKQGVGGISKRVETFEIESRDSFTRLFDKLERVATPKPTPWGLIIAGAGLLITALTAMAGGCLTLILSLAAWANAYFGENISKVEAKADQAIAIHSQSAVTVASIRDALATIAAGRIAEEKEQARLTSQLDAIERKVESLPASQIPK